MYMQIKLNWQIKLIVNLIIMSALFKMHVAFSCIFDSSLWAKIKRALCTTSLLSILLLLSLSASKSQAGNISAFLWIDVYYYD